MARKKLVDKSPSKNSGPTPWVEDDIKYPRQRGICEVCKQKDELKLSYDMHRYICVNAHSCLLRFGKMIQGTNIE